ncbi:unnamed protein product [Vicia faba]|uniref:Transmembrane protein n=1 Tax=Vicia faba TaxID=3906 RepID=A0AAV0ZKK3_VICFA|nr:unnamed protein product [Vicia faba]
MVKSSKFEHIIMEEGCKSEAWWTGGFDVNSGFCLLSFLYSLQLQNPKVTMCVCARVRACVCVFKSVTHEIRPCHLILASFTIPIVICYLFKIKSQLKVHEDERLFVY